MIDFFLLCFKIFKDNKIDIKKIINAIIYSKNLSFYYSLININKIEIEIERETVR